MRQAIDWRSLIFSVTLLVLTASLSSAVLSNLSPVYGSIPTYEYSRLLRIEWLAAAACIVLNQIDASSNTGFILAQIAAIPLILNYGFFCSSSELGPTYGPLLAQFVTCFAPYVFACRHFMQSFPKIHGGIHTVPKVPAHVQPSRFEMWTVTVSTVSAAIFATSQLAFVKLVNYCALPFLNMHAHMSKDITHRSDVLHVLTAIYLLAFAKRISLRQFLLVIVIWVLSILAYGDLPMRNQLSQVNKILKPHGYTILETKNSLTGYISVVENTKDLFRVLRNDHSLLGGIWLPNPERGLLKAESVYPVFNMLEAVRLVGCENCDGSLGISAGVALVIGLGVGTAPSALAQHGIDTNVIEIDPAVIKFAKKYFDLHKDVTTINADALEYVNQAVRAKTRYDYIVHDVFTGGAEPLELFTTAFISNLKYLLKPSGVIAINYAGELTEPHTIATLTTILKTFNDNCKVFRDSDPAGATGEKDIFNMVAFCRNDKEQWSFREPVAADFLQSESRRNALLPRFEIGLNEMIGKIGDLKQAAGKDHILDSRTYTLNSALAHWRIMRTVLPSTVWENY